MSRTGGGKEVLSTAAVVVGVGVGVAAFAGLGLAGAFGAGVLSAATIDNFTARRAKPALQADEVRRDEEGRIERWPQLLKAVQNGGCAPELRAELWPLLLGVFPHHSTHSERSRELEQLRRLYIKLVLVCRELDDQLQALRGGGGGNGEQAGGGAPVAANGCAVGQPAAAATKGPDGAPAAREAGGTPACDPAPPSARRSPPPLPGNLAAFAEAHRIIVMDALRTDMRRSAAPPGLRGGGACPGGGSPTLTILPVAGGEGLPELMLAAPPRDPSAPSTPRQLDAIAADPGAAAAAGRLPRWRSPLAADLIWGAAHLDDPHRCQMLRLANILSAYAVHDPETGYCQGMSDLASVFVQLFDDDALAFACFERLMRAARRNFRHDETGIRHQLQQIARVLRDTDPRLFSALQRLGAADCMFAYRMVVVLLRRELPPAACCTLWEMQWAHQAAAAEAAAAPPAAGGSLGGSRGGGDGAAGGSGGARDSAGAAASAGLRSTVQGLSEVTAAAAGLAQRPGSGGVRQAGSRLASAASGGVDQAPEFVLQFIAAVVRAQRGRIMSECREHDDVLRLFNSLHIDFWPAVAQARKQHRAYTQPGAAVGS